MACGGQIDPACCGVAVGWSSPGCAARLFFLKKENPWEKKEVRFTPFAILEIIIVSDESYVLFEPEGLSLTRESGS